MLGPGETYGAENQDVKTDAEGFDQRSLFHVVLLIVLGISVRQKQPSVFIASSLKVLAFYREIEQTSEHSSLPCLPLRPF